MVLYSYLRSYALPFSVAFSPKLLPLFFLYNIYFNVIKLYNHIVSVAIKHIRLHI